MTTFNIHTENKEQLNALKSFLKALNIKFEIAPDYEIPIEHQHLVLDRIKSSKENDLLNWEDIKDEFDGI